jgi:putative tricarboxylic transport membrane protein
VSADRAGAIVTTVVGLFLIWQGNLLPAGEGAPGPGFFPICTGAGLVVLSVVLLIRPTVKTTIRDLFPLWDKFKPVIEVQLVLVLYAFLLEPLGFILSTSALFLVLLQYHERSNWFFAVLLSVVSTSGSYWLFSKLFDVPLPKGLFAF